MTSQKRPRDPTPSPNEYGFGLLSPRPGMLRASNARIQLFHTPEATAAPPSSPPMETTYTKKKGKSKSSPKKGTKKNTKKKTKGKTTTTRNTRTPPQPHVGVNPAMFRPNSSLKFKQFYDNQLEADVFFDQLDNSIVGSSGPIGYSHIKPMLNGTRPHPFYNDTQFAKHSAETFGDQFHFDHLTHDSDDLIAKISKHHPDTAKHLHALIHTGLHTSWASLDNTIYQYYQASLATDDLYLLRASSSDSGLSLRALLRHTAAAVQFEDVTMAAMSSLTAIKKIKFSAARGALHYFSRIETAKVELTKLGYHYDLLSQLDLCTHILAMFKSADPAYAAKITWLTKEASATPSRFNMTFPNIRLQMLLVERTNGLRRRAHTRSGKLHANFTAPSPAPTVNLVGAGPQHNQDWNRPYPQHQIDSAVQYARTRFSARNPGAPEPGCYNCRPVGAYNGHKTPQCWITLKRCHSGAITESTICPGHPDGTHTRQECKNGGKPTRGKSRHNPRSSHNPRHQSARTQPRPHSNAPTNSSSGARPHTTNHHNQDPAAQLAQLRAFMAMPTTSRAAIMEIAGIPKA